MKGREGRRVCAFAGTFGRRLPPVQLVAPESLPGTPSLEVVDTGQQPGPRLLTSTSLPSLPHASRNGGQFNQRFRFQLTRFSLFFLNHPIHRPQGKEIKQRLNLSSHLRNCYISLMSPAGDLRQT